jgi:hypothetical protein
MKITSIKTGQYSERPSTRVKLFVFHRNETILENLMLRHRRPSDLYRKEVLPKVFKKLKLDPSRITWSQKAGCSCGCSPGFILNADPSKLGYDAIYVNIK